MALKQKKKKAFENSDAQRMIISNIVSLNAQLIEIHKINKLTPAH